MRLSVPGDVRYIYAAWKLGGTPLNAIEADGPDSFADAFAEHVSARYDVAYTMIADPPGKSAMPVGVVFGIAPFYGQNVMWIGDFLWFPWASPRNKIESAVHFFNQLRKECTVIGFAEPEVIDFFEHICRYGVMRRAGTVFDMFREGAMAVFQTRKPYMAGRPK